MTSDTRDERPSPLTVAEWALDEILAEWDSDREEEDGVEVPYTNDTGGIELCREALRRIRER